MRVLVACEYSGAVRREFRAMGHDAWSCDLLASEDSSPHHIRGNVISHEIIKQGWDVLIAFPDCTYLTVSGARHMQIPWRQEAMKWAVAFVKTLWALPIKHKAVENPIGRPSTLWQEPTQIVHPWMFGDAESKATCLWLDNLPPLVPTHSQKGDMFTPELGEEIRTSIHHEPPGPDRWKNRSRTFPGIAKAFAAQWGHYLEKAA